MGLFKALKQRRERRKEIKSLERSDWGQRLKLDKLREQEKSLKLRAQVRKKQKAVKELKFNERSGFKFDKRAFTKNVRGIKKSLGESKKRQERNLERYSLGDGSKFQLGPDKPKAKPKSRARTVVIKFDGEK